AETQQHALHAFEHRGVGAAEANGDALGLRALHAALGVEQAAQEAAVEVARTALDGGRYGLTARSHAELVGELGNRRETEAEFTAAADLVPARELGAMIQAAGGIERRRHHGVRTAHTH